MAAPKVLNATELLAAPEVLDVTELLVAPEVLDTTVLLAAPEVLDVTELLVAPEVLDTTVLLGAPKVLDETELLVAPEVLDTTVLLGALKVLDETELLVAPKVLTDEDENMRGEEDSRGIKLVEELLEEVVATVVGDRWMEGMEEEVEELMALFNLPLAGEQESLEIKCANCNKVFKTKQLLYFHIRKQHENPGTCNICEKYFSSKVKLDCHIQKAHMYGPEKQPRKYLCETCGKVFKDRSNMNKHAKIHGVKEIQQKKPCHKPKPFPCNQCQKSYSRQWTLKRHMVTKHKKPQKHRGHHRSSLYMHKSSAKKLPCPVCRKTFMRLHNWKNHIHTVHKPAKKKPSSSSCSSRKLPKTYFHCSLCPKKFSSKQGMWDHKYRVHRSERYRCTACDKTFKRKFNLARHTKIHSGPGRHRKAHEELSRQQQLDRMKKIVDKFNEDIKDFSEEDKKKMFQRLVKSNPDVLNLYSTNPLSEEDVIEMVRDGNLSDRQVLKILVIIRRRWGSKAITANVQKLLKERKKLLDHLFTVELLAAEDEVHFVDKDGQPITRSLVYCTDLLALTEAKQVLEEEEYESVLGIDDGKDLLKV